MFKLLQVYDSVYPMDPTLPRVTLKLRVNGPPIVKSLLKDYRNITPKVIVLISFWYGAYGSYKNKNGKKQ